MERGEDLIWLWVVIIMVIQGHITGESIDLLGLFCCCRCDNKGKSLEDWKECLAKSLPVVYNKEDFLNPYFVVYGKRKK